MDDLKLRHANLTDLARVIELLGESTFGLAEAIYGTAGLTARLSRPGSVVGIASCVVADHAGQVIGEMLGYDLAHAAREGLDAEISPDRRWLLAPFRSTALPQGWYLSSLAVHPDWRRRGIGRILLRAAALRARDNKSSTIVLHVFENKTAAINLYRQAGFDEVARARTPDHPIFSATGDLIFMAAKVDRILVHSRGDRPHCTGPS